MQEWHLEKASKAYALAFGGIQHTEEIAYASPALKEDIAGLTVQGNQTVAERG